MDGWSEYLPVEVECSTSVKEQRRRGVWQRNKARPHTEKPYTILCLGFEKVVLAFYPDCFKLIIMTPSEKKKN